MSVITKIAVVGVTAIGALIAVASLNGGALADEVRDTCNGQVTVGNYNANPSDDRSIIVNPGEQARGEVDLNDQGWIRWYCADGEGLTAYRQDCIDGADVALVEVRLRDDGGLRIACT